MVTGAAVVSTPECSEFYPIKRGARLAPGGAFVTIPFRVLHGTSIATYRVIPQLRKKRINT